MTAYRQSWFEGWRLFGLLALTLTALCIWIAGMRGFEVEGVRAAIRFRGADLAAVLPRLLRRGAGAAVAECVDAMATPQPPLSRRHRPPRTDCTRSRSCVSP